jgi:hypothetical protein
MSGVRSADQARGGRRLVGPPSLLLREGPIAISGNQALMSAVIEH